MAMQHRARQRSRLNSHSQPDLTYTGYVMPSATDPQASVPQIRNHSKMAAAMAERSARQRRYKIKKRMESQAHYAAQSPLRPTSAIDFAGPQQRADREQVVMRPHSVMGPFPGDGRNRVIQVYSRKPPRSGHRASDSGVSSSVPPHHVLRSSPKPSIVVNGHWDPAGGGDHAGHHAHLVVDYDDEEDDTRALSDTHSSGSHKLSSPHSQEAVETETDNSDDYSQEDLAAALSHHLNGGGGVVDNHHMVSAHELRVNHHVPRQLQYPAHNGVDDQGNEEVGEEEEEEEDENVDVQLDSPESDSLHSSQHQSHKPPESMSEELKLDLTCFHDDNEGKPRPLPKRSLPAEPKLSVVKDSTPDTHYPLSMKPMMSNTNNSAEGVLTVADRSQTEPPKGVVESLSGDRTDKVTSLPPIRPQDALPNINDNNSRVFHTDIDRAPARRSVTPSEFSNASRPVMRRAATPSDYIGVSESMNSKAGRRRKDSKNASSENLHRSIDDVSLSASKKKPFRTSLKNLFQRKK